VLAWLVESRKIYLSEAGIMVEAKYNVKLNLIVQAVCKFIVRYTQRDCKMLLRTLGFSYLGRVFKLIGVPPLRKFNNSLQLNNTFFAL
jgi:hypothetical protein